MKQWAVVRAGKRPERQRKVPRKRKAKVVCVERSTAALGLTVLVASDSGVDSGVESDNEEEEATKKTRRKSKKAPKKGAV